MNLSFFKKKRFILKGISLLTGLFIWVYVVSSAEVELNKEVPIIVDIPDGLAIKNEIPKSVIYRVKGPGLFVRKFFEEQETLNIAKTTFGNNKKKRTLVDLAKLKSKLPLGLELVSVEPRKFFIQLEKSLTKMVKVKADFSPGILDKYKIQKLQFGPKEVEISGPKSLVRKIKFISTKEIESLNVGLNKEVKIPLINPDSRIKVSQKNISASMELVTKTINRVIANHPIIFQSVGLIKNASQKNVELVLSGKEKDIENLDLDAVQVIALIPRSKKGQMSIELITELPQGIKVVEIKPKNIKVVVE